MAIGSTSISGGLVATMETRANDGMNAFVNNFLVNGRYVDRIKLKPQGKENNPPAPIEPVVAVTGPLEPIYRFSSPEEFGHRHIKGTEKEYELESLSIGNFNREEQHSKAWALSVTPISDEEESYLILVEWRHEIATLLPRLGDRCLLGLYDVERKKLKAADWWSAERMPCHIELQPEGILPTSRLVFFKVTLAVSTLKPLIDPILPRGVQLHNIARVKLDDRNSIAMQVNFQISDATMKAELGAWDKLCRAEPGKVSKKQLAAFRWWMTLDNPEIEVDLFDRFPAIRDPSPDNLSLPKNLTERFCNLNDSQRKAWKETLSKLPCGVGIIPGGPGGGKTHWVLLLAAFILHCGGRILYLLDINQPLDDATRRLFHLVDDVEKRKGLVRMKNWSYELKHSLRFGSGSEGTRLDSTSSALDEGFPDVDYSKAFMTTVATHTSSRVQVEAKSDLPTLDEAAWQFYQEHEKDYRRITEILDNSEGNPADDRSFKWEVNRLYEKVLKKAHFIATTPVAASTYFSKLFAPDLVIFDEAPHARELSSLISVAHFNPAAWLFCGDFRQTLPYVGNPDGNPYAAQMQVTMMSRAYQNNIIKHQLLINHRAYGHLERLPSKLFYDGQMTSGISADKMFPNSITHLKEWFSKYLNGTACEVPRYIVHIRPVGLPLKDGTSWHNPVHRNWSMKRVLELLQDKSFCRIDRPNEPGTVLLLSPYRSAIKFYREAIEEMALEHPELAVIERVEARTWDTAQGHEADVVGIDFVRDRPTKFMNGKHRLNVGITRARQAEWLLIHPGMKYRKVFWEMEWLSRIYRACMPGGLDGVREGNIIDVRV